MEIERKFLIKQLPEDLETYPSQILEQAYLCTEPVVRVRQSDDEYTLTYKSKGLMSREEYNLPLTAESYTHLKKKADGNIIKKRRYRIPWEGGLTIELDIFSPPFQGLILGEVEFISEEQAKAFLPPDWFGEEVTWSTEYHNSTLSQKRFPEHTEC
ncbi:MAG: CYTH domain-containing protein [Lachnospiraceae bacterium]|jgi:adenylate cyclase|nr:CYTH domain-containing protein [Lachnospiraceae bacterium]